MKLAKKLCNEVLTRLMETSNFIHVSRMDLLDRKEAIMAAKLTTCPAKVCTCGGTEQVTVREGIDRRSGRPTRTYGPCAPLVAQGWTNKVAVVEWADKPQTVVRHRDGLVSFAL